MLDWEFNDRDSFERWLTKQPIGFLWILSTRAALRTIPFLSHLDLTKSTNFRSALIVFRANLSAWSACKYKVDPSENNLSILNEIANGYAVNYSILAAETAAFAHMAWGAHVSRNKAEDAVRAIRFSDSIMRFKIDFLNIFREDYSQTYGADVDSRASVLAEKALWQTGHIPGESARNWKALAKSLVSAGDGWDIWVDWYEARLNGRPSINAPADIVEELDVSIAQIPNDLWEQGPAVVNAKIRELYREAREKARQRLPVQGKLGAQWVAQTATTFQIVHLADPSDLAATSEAKTQQLHASLRSKSNKFMTQCAGVEDRIGWDGFEDAVANFRKNVDRSLAEVAAEVTLLYDATITLASFIEYNQALANDPYQNTQPLPHNLARSLTDLIRTAAPFVRQFPTALELDDEAGAFLTDPKLFEAPARRIIIEAEKDHLISEADRKLVTDLLAAIERGDFQGRKAGVRGTQSVRNLIFTVAVSIVSGNYGSKSPAVDEIGDFLVRQEVAITQMIKEEAADVRETFRSLIEDAKARQQAPDERGHDPLLAVRNEEDDLQN